MNSSSVREPLAWLLAAGAAALAFCVALVLSLFLLAVGLFPTDFVEPVSGFMTSLLVILAGASLAPRQRFVVALVLFVASTILITTYLRLHLAGTLVGGFTSVACVGWWDHLRRTGRSTRRVAIGAVVVVLVLTAVGLARIVDQPARPVALVPELDRALGASAARVTAFHRYDRGGFIDHQWLWRIDATPDVIALVVKGLGLREADSVPRAFWWMPPHYWPRGLPAEARAFRSAAFTADGRGPDGVHYFLLHDPARNRAFVWVKSNF